MAMSVLPGQSAERSALASLHLPTASPWACAIPAGRKKRERENTGIGGKGDWEEVEG